MKKNKKNYEFGKGQKKANNQLVDKGYWIPTGYNVMQFPEYEEDQGVAFNNEEEFNNFNEFVTSAFVRGMVLQQYEENGTVKRDDFLKMIPWLDWSKPVTFETLHNEFGVEAPTYTFTSLYGDCNYDHPLLQDWNKFWTEAQHRPTNN